MAKSQRLTNDSRFGYSANQRWREDYYLVTDMVNPDSELEALSATGNPLPGVFSIPFGDGCAVDSNERVRIIGLGANGYSTLWVSRASYKFDYPSQRRSSRVYESGIIEMGLPNWTNMTTASQNLYVEVPEEYRVRHTRRRISRVANKTNAGITIDQVANFDGANAGKRYIINSIPYIYMGTQARMDPTNHSDVTVEFMTTAPVPAYPAGTYPGYSIALPALGNLEEYVLTPPSFATGPTPTITVRPATAYPLLTTIPWYP